MRSSYIFALLSLAYALGSMLCGLAVVNVYEACDRTWAKDVSSKPGLARIDIHIIAGFDAHALSIVLYTFIYQLAEYIPHHLHPLFDIM